MDEQKLNSAPINNLDAERSVASIQHELAKVRGANQLQAASSSHVIAKSLDLTEGKVIDKSIREMERKRVVPSIVEAWESKQEELSKDGLTEKETQSRATDKRRNADLVKLKAFNGPFSSAAEVKAFTASDLPEEKKVERLYIEVRYARDTCVSFPKNSDIFRLLKNYRKLDSKSYTDNLVIYFDKVKFLNSVEMSDFENALKELHWVTVKHFLINTFINLVLFLPKGTHFFLFSLNFIQFYRILLNFTQLYLAIFFCFHSRRAQ